MMSLHLEIHKYLILTKLYKQRTHLDEFLNFSFIPCSITELSYLMDLDNYSETTILALN